MENSDTSRVVQERLGAISMLPLKEVRVGAEDHTTTFETSGRQAAWFL